MRTSRVWRLAVALAAATTAVVLVPAGSASAASCIQAATPPAPPARGAVLWSPLVQGSTANNTLILNYGDHYSEVADCWEPTQDPWSISVAPGGALVFYGLNSSTRQSDSLFSPWGAVNASAGSGPLEIVPNTSGQWENWEMTTSVGVVDPAVALGTYTSCRHCDLSNATVTLPGRGDLINGPIVGFVGDVTGTTWSGATVTGSGFGYNFSGADLSEAWFSADLTFATFGTVTANRTDFRGSLLQGATFAAMGFQFPPSFAGTTLGGDDICTRIANTNLLDVSFVATNWDSSGCTGAAFPGSQVPLSAVGQLLVAAKGRGVDFTGAQVVASSADRSALAGADLTGLNLANLTLLGEAPDLTGTKLDGATLTNATFDLARLAGASLTNISAAGASFEGADLSASNPHPAANLSGANTNLHSADFDDANVSGVSFVGADISDASFTGARGRDTDFSGVRAHGAVFTDAHLYGNAQAFDDATDLANADFSGAVLAGDATQSGGFDLTGAPLAGAHFDGTVCVACNLTGATLNQATFTGAYFPGVDLSQATLTGAQLARAWLYCGSLTNDWCATVPDSQQLWSWPLALGSGEAYGPVPFAATDLTGVSMADVATCPDSAKPSGTPPSCAGQLLPKVGEAPVFPAPCSASFRGACPTPTSTLFQAGGTTSPLAVAPTAPPTWNTPPSDTQGYYVALDDSTIQLVGGGPASIVAGTSGTKCASPTSTCGDGGPATSALLGRPSGLAVGLDGSVYVADSELLRVRRIDPSGTITTIAGTGALCPGPDEDCGDGGPAVSARLAAANGVAVDTHGAVFIADGVAGVLRVDTEGTIDMLADGDVTGPVVALAISADGPIYATTRSPDRVIQIDPITEAITPVVGTGTSGYNGNEDGNGFLLPGTQVQVNQPTGLSVDLDGKVLFADTGNHLIRAYVPSTSHVTDPLAGVVVNGLPQGGFNGDDRFASDTELSGPQAVAATDGALVIIADTGNQRVRQVGPGPEDTLTAPAPAVQAVISCELGRVWSCQRLPRPSGRLRTLNFAVTISHQGVEVASGQWVLPGRGGLRFLVTEQRPLTPGPYELTIHLAGVSWTKPIQLTPG